MHLVLLLIAPRIVATTPDSTRALVRCAALRCCPQLAHNNNNHTTSGTQQKMALLWIVIAGAAISFILVRPCPALKLLRTSVPLTPPAQAWSLGANDVANAVPCSHPFFYLFYLLFIK